MGEERILPDEEKEDTIFATLIRVEKLLLRIVDILEKEKTRIKTSLYNYSSEDLMHELRCRLG